MIELAQLRSCCAAWEINNLSQADTPEDALFGLRWHFAESDRRKPFVVFTGVTFRHQRDHASSRDDDYGQALADYIMEHGMGTIQATEAKVNPVSGNSVRIWVWVPDWLMTRKVIRDIVDKTTTRHVNIP